MPNLGAPELIIIVIIGLLIPIGIGYWCMVVFRRKGKSAGAGFALGFFLTFFLSLIGAVIAMLIAYLQSPASAGAVPGAALAPSPPPPVSPSAQTIATFGPTTGWYGKRIVYDAGGIVIEGVGPVSASGVLSYETQGQIEWASAAMRDWLVGVAQSAQA
jgi:hypothetical protein